MEKEKNPPQLRRVLKKVYSRISRRAENRVFTLTYPSKHQDGVRFFDAGQGGTGGAAPSLRAAVQALPPAPVWTRKEVD